MLLHEYLDHILSIIQKYSIANLILASDIINNFRFIHLNSNIYLTKSRNIYCNANLRKLRLPCGAFYTAFPKANALRRGGGSI